MILPIKSERWGGVWVWELLILPLWRAPAKLAAADLGRDATVLLRGLSIPWCQSAYTGNYNTSEEIPTLGVTT